jgi:hypothetical protein
VEGSWSVRKLCGRGSAALGFWPSAIVDLFFLGLESPSIGLRVRAWPGNDDSVAGVSLAASNPGILCGVTSYVELGN